MIKPFARFSLKMLEELCTEFVKKASVSWKISSVTVEHYLRCKLIYTHNLHILWPIWMKFSMEELHVMPFSGLQFCETHWSDRRTLLQGINGILPMFSTFLVW
jgi:hypothetical protein